MAEKTPSKFVGLKMPTALNSKIERIARIEGNTPSAVIRRLLTSAIQQEEERLDPHEAA